MQDLLQRGDQWSCIFHYPAEGGSQEHVLQQNWTSVKMAECMQAATCCCESIQSSNCNSCFLKSSFFLWWGFYRILFAQILSYRMCPQMSVCLSVCLWNADLAKSSSYWLHTGHVCCQCICIAEFGAIWTCDTFSMNKKLATSLDLVDWVEHIFLKLRNHSSGWQLGQTTGTNCGQIIMIIKLFYFTISGWRRH